jgi:23S rRNA pseudouridine2605 synthase
MRIAKYLASCGLGSRRFCEELILSGRVKINKKQITTPALNIDPETDVVSVNDALVKPKELVYYLLNKPIGYTSSRFDEHAKKIITDLLPQEPPIWPVGRLDKDTSGLIILTNDGDLTNRLTHPKYQKEKEYLITLDLPLEKGEIEKIKNGVELEDGWIKADSFEVLSEKKYRIIIHEGRNRLIRRLINSFGKEVVSLERLRLGPLTLGDLGVGRYRDLTKSEISELINDL